MSQSCIMVQGFNQAVQHPIDMIWLNLIVGNLNSGVLFHVIDAKVAYRLILRRPCVRENGLVPLTLH